MNINKVMLAGNVCADAEVRQGGKESFATFSLAVNQSKDKGVDFVPCVAFGKVGEIAGKYLKKGKPVFLEGRFSSRKSGKVTYHGVTVFNIQFLGTGEKKETESATEAPSGDDNNPFI